MYQPGKGLTESKIDVLAYSTAWDDEVPFCLPVEHYTTLRILTAKVGKCIYFRVLQNVALSPTLSCILHAGSLLGIGNT